MDRLIYVCRVPRSTLRVGDSLLNGRVYFGLIQICEQARTTHDHLFRQWDEFRGSRQSIQEVKLGKDRVNSNGEENPMDIQSSFRSMVGRFLGKTHSECQRFVEEDAG